MLSGTDYCPFGMAMRIGVDSSYRYGFNGQENDNEVKWGMGNQLDYGFRIYDPRIAKFLSVDPFTHNYPWYTPYQFAGNKPIAAVDLDGLEEKIVTLQQFSLPRMDVVLKVNKAPDPYTISLGPNPRIDKEVVAATLISAAQNMNPKFTIPTNGQFVFLEYPDNPEKNAAGYSVEIGGELHHFTYTPEVVKLAFDNLSKAKVNLGLGAELLNLVGAGVALKAELKTVSAELKAGSQEAGAIFQTPSLGETLAAKYSNERPKLSQGVINTVWERAKQADGNVYDPHTGELLSWDKSRGRFDQWHMGHKPGHEYKQLIEKLRKGEISEADFKKEVRNPDNYQPESPSSNMSHQYEQK